MHLAVDLHVDLINILTPLPETPHPVDPLPPNVRREQRIEPSTTAEPFRGTRRYPAQIASPRRCAGATGIAHEA